MSNVINYSLADSFMRSALAADSPVMPLDEFRDWFHAERGRSELRVRRIPFADLDQWHFTDGMRSLVHRSGKFFSIEGLQVKTDFGPVSAWDQPIINQPEIGILGVITRHFDGVPHFLLQAKTEPGNVNGLQLSPTEQATRSNYSRVHGGRLPPYHEYFVKAGRARTLVDRLMGEQGSRFLRKRNRNIIIEVDEDLPLLDGFCWLTLGQIKRLLRQDNLINMDLRSALSCIPLADTAAGAQASPEFDRWQFEYAAHDLIDSLFDRDSALNTECEIVNWITDLRARYEMKVERRPLGGLERWRMSESQIHHETEQHFSVIAVEVEAAAREVVRWSQPLLDHSGRGLNGFLMQRHNGVLHFLVRACMYPGNRELFELGSTVSRSNADQHFGKADAPPFLDLFHNPPESWIRYDAIQSEEGGRFYHYQNRYVILELPPDLRLETPENFCWMTLGQIQAFLQHGYFNIEGRNVLACLDFSGAGPSEGEPG